ncbi:MAG: hypothetical protein KDC09_11440 [Bacteroidales bacterium]|nr:hypothetical protein [Bacteroidales bacterium]
MAELPPAPRSGDEKLAIAGFFCFEKTKRQEKFIRLHGGTPSSSTFLPICRQASFVASAKEGFTLSRNTEGFSGCSPP